MPRQRRTSPEQDVHIGPDDELSRAPTTLHALSSFVSEFTRARDRAHEQGAKGVAAVRGAKALGVRPGVFRLAVVLREMDQRQRDRWFDEFDLMVHSLGLPVQGRLGLPYPEPSEEEEAAD